MSEGRKARRSSRFSQWLETLPNQGASCNNTSEDAAEVPAPVAPAVAHAALGAASSPLNRTPARASLSLPKQVLHPKDLFLNPKWFRVVAQPHVVVHVQPDLQAATVGLLDAGELLEAEETKEGWVKLSDAEREARSLPRDCEGWVLRDGSAESLGELLEPYNPGWFQVIFEPRVPVRRVASLKAPAIAFLNSGEIIKAAELMGGWVRLSPGDRRKLDITDDCGSWVLINAPAVAKHVGRLLAAVPFGKASVGEAAEAVAREAEHQLEEEAAVAEEDGADAFFVAETLEEFLLAARPPGWSLHTIKTISHYLEIIGVYSLADLEHELQAGRASLDDKFEAFGLPLLDVTTVERFQQQMKRQQSTQVRCAHGRHGGLLGLADDDMCSPLPQTGLQTKVQASNPSSSTAYPCDVAEGPSTVFALLRFASPAWPAHVTQEAELQLSRVGIVTAAELRQALEDEDGCLDSLDSRLFTAAALDRLRLALALRRRTGAADLLCIQVASDSSNLDSPSSSLRTSGPTEFYCLHGL
eukprot:TRINITY_DN88986_c0_g1_i1.p1 TRINITY_DN88986_c0_g1~~TRINITY_DN88986_c0_g1_i1.p1  ORF type:complete len:528 (+),score=112.68 TRINITY_DN88986_c0_g1_i1:93-1676(+)